MVDVIVSLLAQQVTQQPVVSATQTWVPTASVAVTAGLLLPAPKAIAVPSSGEITVTVEPCDGTAGWYWTVTTTVDGAIVDQRCVLVPATGSGIPRFEDLVSVSMADYRSHQPGQVWVGLDDDPPPSWFKGWWLVSAPGSPALGDDTGSGDLRLVS